MRSRNYPGKRNMIQRVHLVTIALSVAISVTINWSLEKSTVTLSNLNTDNMVKESLSIEDKLSLKFYEKTNIKPMLVSVIEGHNYAVIYSERGTFYSDLNGKTLITGKMIDFDSGKNLGAVTTEKNRNKLDDIARESSRFKALVENADTVRTKIAPHEMQSTVSGESAVEMIENNALLKAQKMKVDKEEDKLHARIQQSIATKTAPKKVVEEPSSISNSGKSLEQADYLQMLASMPLEERTVEGLNVAKILVPNMPDDIFIVYEANQNVPFKGTLTIATDFSCPICKKLHRMIPTLNDAGIKVRYYPYPRANVVDLARNELENLTLDKHLAYIVSKPLNFLGQTYASAICADDRNLAFDELFTLGGLQQSSVMTNQCEQQFKELKVVGELLFTNQTPKMVWGDSTTDISERGTILGFDAATDVTASALLSRLQR